MDQGLSPDQVKNIYGNITGKPISVVMYDKIIATPDIDTFFSPKQNCIIIFYPSYKNNNLTMGHFVALIRHMEGHNVEYRFFDPLGYNIDKFKQFTQRRKLYKENTNSLVNHLLHKVISNGTTHVDYNERQIQSRKSTVAVCGYHCIFRCMYHYLTNDDYYRLLKILQQRYKKDKGKLFDNLIYSLFNA